MSGEKNRAPRLKEQYKDNAIEVFKNIEAKDKLRKKDIQHKNAEQVEQEHCPK